MVPPGVCTAPTMVIGLSRRRRYPTCQAWIWAGSKNSLRFIQGHGLDLGPKPGMLFRSAYSGKPSANYWIACSTCSSWPLSELSVSTRSSASNCTAGPGRQPMELPAASQIPTKPPLLPQPALRGGHLLEYLTEVKSFQISAEGVAQIRDGRKVLSHNPLRAEALTCAVRPDRLQAVSVLSRNPYFRRRYGRDPGSPTAGGGRAGIGTRCPHPGSFAGGHGDPPGLRRAE
jgi:hypothetical protein